MPGVGRGVRQLQAVQKGRLDDWDDDEEWYYEEEVVPQLDMGYAEAGYHAEPEVDDEGIYETGILDSDGNPIMVLMRKEPVGFLAFDDEGNLHPRHKLFPE